MQVLQKKKKKMFLTKPAMKKSLFLKLEWQRVKGHQGQICYKTAYTSEVNTEPTLSNFPKNLVSSLNLSKARN